LSQRRASFITRAHVTFQPVLTPQLWALCGAFLVSLIQKARQASEMPAGVYSDVACPLFRNIHSDWPQPKYPRCVNVARHLILISSRSRTQPHLCLDPLDRFGYSAAQSGSLVIATVSITASTSPICYMCRQCGHMLIIYLIPRSSHS